MTPEETAKKLFALAKRAPMANYQENELLKTAARQLMECQQRLDDAAERVAVLEEQIAIMEEDKPGGDDSFEPESFGEGLNDDFWDDFWPIGES